ncbi:IMP dehydrogenase [Candidatus Microgenomates bacterium]|nr:IMP dehydrogenase [Candidatus Microgenomates bacterium]
MSDKIVMHGLTFDDVLLIPGYSDFRRADISLETTLTKKITLRTPLVSSPMDTVTESRLALELARLGGLGIIHRNLTVAQQADEVAKVKKANHVVGAAIGVNPGYEERVKALLTAGADIICLDSAHGYTNTMLDVLKTLKKQYRGIEIMAGNIATAEAAGAFAAAGADTLRAGMGPGSICTTRIISGMGMPQITTILETSKAVKGTSTTIISDGGVKYSGDMVKALAAGAHAVMSGTFFSSAEEAPGDVHELHANEIPRRFKSIVDQNNPDKLYKFKSYRGMGSIGAMNHGAAIKSEDEYHGKSYKDRVLVAEGVEGLVPVKGSLQMLIDQAVGGMKSGMYYVGVKTIAELQEKSKFIQITQASLTESHPHDILVTNPGENYQ